VEIVGLVGRGWDLVPTGGRDRPFVDAILDQVERARCVDRRRVYATGFSNGGFFANLLACTLGDRLAAVAAVGGAAALPDCTPLRPMPILLLHGSADQIIDPAMVRRARTWWAEQNHCGTAVTERGCVHFEGCAADVVHCEGPHAHRWPSGGLATVWRFFQTHPHGGDPA
jgi:poly(3-hydroxybutyrate) depolymerase